MTTSRIRVVADADIPGLESCLPKSCELLRVSAREISPERLVDADALLVRTLTRVDGELLNGSKLSFVGSATSGSDHVDVGYLKSRGIRFAHAAGSNANAVVDYCFAVLAQRALASQLDPLHLSYGIVGAGNVGGRLIARLKALGCRVVASDPPLQATDGGISVNGADYASLEEALRCDVVSLHVPLVPEGPHPTQNLLEEAGYKKLAEDSLLINTSRGAVIDEQGLLTNLASGRPGYAALDVWQGEPEIDSALAGKADIATPHIAGYSALAKQAATDSIAAQLMEFFRLPLESEHRGNGVERQPVMLDTSSCHSAWEIVAQALPLHSISMKFKTAVARGETATVFGAMRAELRQRKEFRQLSIDESTAATLGKADLELLEALGFNIL